MSHRSFSAFLVLCLAILACNLPSSKVVTQEIAQTATEIATQSATATSTEISTETATPTETSTQVAPESPAITSTNTTQPCNQASFVTDVTVPDGTKIEFNDNFIKTWRLKNVGSCTWTSGYTLVFENGDQMGGPATQQLTNGTVAPGQTIDVSVDLVAPNTAGTYRGNWKIREPGGILFGLSTGAFWVEIKAIAPSQQPPPPPAALPDWPLYKQGSSGPEVYAIQYLLRFHGQNPTPDGIFGPQTKSAVTAFQTQEGLSVDGIVGPKTWSALIAGAQVSKGSSSEAVRAVQTLLKEKYSYNLAVDGAFGNKTDNAVNDFQANHGLSVDGIVGPKTWQALIGY